jgi:hypothetical protein
LDALALPLEPLPLSEPPQDTRAQAAMAAAAILLAQCVLIIM